MPDNLIGALILFALFFELAFLVAYEKGVFDCFAAYRCEQHDGEIARD